LAPIENFLRILYFSMAGYVNCCTHSAKHKASEGHGLNEN
jgi:hypothetical protein